MPPIGGRIFKCNVRELLADDDDDPMSSASVSSSMTGIDAAGALNEVVTISLLPMDGARFCGCGIFDNACRSAIVIDSESDESLTSMTGTVGRGGVKAAATGFTKVFGTGAAMVARREDFVVVATGFC